MDKGAHFYRCDLQVHSPRDTNWRGQACVTHEERRAYATTLVQACRDRGLQAVAITDHHDMLFVTYVRQAAEEETDEAGNALPEDKRLVVFPGMELTLGVPCQALLIFDADFPEDLFALALTALAIAPSPDDDAKISPVSRLDSIQSLDQLKKKLDEHSYLRQRYIILPHVGENGQFSLIRKGQQGKYKDMPCVGGFVDGSLEKLGRGKQDIIQGKSKEWGNRRIACFQSSDNRREDHEHLGRFTTWIKWAVPTAEALRQACLAQESRVLQEEPLLPSVTISSISVSNSSFLGPLDLELNVQFSALIGGRGTGKSTILEYLRWALCDQPPPSSEDADTPNYLARRARLIEQTLTPFDATVEVRFDVNGAQHVVRRSSTDGELVLKIAEGEMRPCSEEEVRRLLPIQAYSQKQLSDVGVRVEELSRFIMSPVRADLDGLEVSLTGMTERVRETYATVRRFRTLTRSLDERALYEKSLSEQADSLRARLTGVSDEDRQLLDRGKLFTNANQYVDSWQDAVARFLNAAVELRDSVVAGLADEALPPDEPDKEILAAAHDEYRGLLLDAKEGLDALVARAQTVTAEPELLKEDSPWRRWARIRGEFGEAYEAAVQRSSSHAETMVQLTTIEEQLRKHNRESARLREELKSLSKAEEDYRTERDAWQELLRKQADVLDAQCEKLTKDSGGAIRARVRRLANSTEFVVRLKQALSGSRVPGSKLEGLGEAITQAETFEERARLWVDILDDLEKLADFDVERTSSARRPEAPTLAALGLSDANLERIGRSLKSNDWLALSLTPLASLPDFEYQAREGEYIPFRNASAGQQATALLKTLLNQGGPPLIIDQPEEDLDNPVMLEIVRGVWRAKQERQLIFASHNANLVVNGDADLVAWCDYRTTGDQSRGTVAGEGAIDVDKVRDAIKRIMEGGEAAFNLRKQKYGF